MALENTKDNRQYASLLSDGKFHLAVDENTPGAVAREYESSDKKNKGVKHELLFDTLSGVITGIFFRDGDYGNQLHIIIDGVDLSLNADNNFAGDFMKKLPNINIEDEVSMSGYSFNDSQSGKLRRGISISQGEEKLKNFFFDVDKKKTLHNFPVPEGDTSKFKADDWKMHFMKVTKFLVTYTEENHLVGEAPVAKTDSKEEISAEEVAEKMDEKEDEKA